jgi:hypothetical protein
MVKKLGVIVPYRDREEHLIEFKKKITKYLKRKDIPFEIIIVNQDNGKLFNRGMLLNIGFKYAEKLNCDYVVFHDVDMLPIYVDYDYPEKPIHLANNLWSGNNEIRRKKITTFDQYFGGVTIFNMDDFKKINGYSNKYWGWGYEDDDLLLRCEKNNLDLDVIKIKNNRPKSTALFFNGLDSYVKSKNIIDLNKNISIFASFYPEDFVCDHTKETDEFSVFSIPGYDTIIGHNSFSRYNFITFTSNGNVIYINSKRKTNYKTTICVTFDFRSKIINVYQDGELLEVKKYENNLLNYTKEPFFYLGVSNPDRTNNEKYFKGHIDRFAIYSKILNEDEIKNITDNEIEKSNSLMLHYDASEIKNYKLIDLSGNNNDGEIVKCAIKKLELPEYNNEYIPHRRDCTFLTLSHEENGFFDNKWKSQTTRWNQLRFINEVSKNDDLLYNDGLSDLEFVEHGVINEENNITHVNVGI